jgi:hypothetical protein
MNDAYATPARSKARTGSPEPYMVRSGVMTCRACPLCGKVRPPSKDT